MTHREASTVRGRISERQGQLKNDRESVGMMVD